MEATFQSYLTEAVYEAVATTRGNSGGGGTAGHHQRGDPISFIDDSDGEQQHQLLLHHQQSQQPPPPLPVKMRVKNAAAARSIGGCDCAFQLPILMDYKLYSIRGLHAS